MEATLTPTTDAHPEEAPGADQPSAFADYSDAPMPLPQYAQFLLLFNLAFAVFLAISRQTGRPIPERVPVGDILLVGVATFKLSRTISKEMVTSPIRAAFTQFEDFAGEGEVNEKVRGEGLQRTVGELLTCPFCLGMWVAAFFAYGLVLAPPLTRFVATILTTKAISDWLHVGYTAACKATD
ncbi:MAG: DUF1360 domain-containing protein [Actinomycetota bacterium]